VKCHAVNGVGAKIGPDLAQASRGRSLFDLATAMWNHRPRMADRMRPLGIDRPTLSDTETRNLVAFLYTRNYFDPPGSPEIGKKLFADKKCVLCHQVGGGGAVGPALDALKQWTSPIAVAAEMWNHGPQMSQAMKDRQVGVQFHTALNGFQRPTFTGAELRDLIAYLGPATSGPADGHVYVLPGRTEVGRTLFTEKGCVQCHSVAGAGGQVGPDLAESTANRSPMEFAAALWNKAPAMTATMRQRGVAAPTLVPEEMADLVGYSYSVRYFTSGSISGGWKVVASAGCLDCHAVYGERGKTASDLTRLTGVDTPSAVIGALWNHTGVPSAAPGGKPVAWPAFTLRETTDLLALLQSMQRR